MTKGIAQLFKVLSLVALMLAFTNANAQTNFQNTLRNVVQTSDRTLEFDIYLLNTDIGHSMEMATYQAGIILNPAIYAGGTLTASIVAGSSTLTKSAQIPTSTTYSASSTIVKLAPKPPPGIGNGSIISQVNPGTRIIRLKLTSTVPFAPNSKPEFFFAPSTVGIPSYPTAVALYVNSLNVQEAVTMGVNAFVIDNPVLNPPVTAFSVSGGGSYCQGSGGLPVDLVNSENGVTYTLIKDGIPQVPSVDGIGSAISFGNQLAGTYTVSGINVGGTALMTGSAIISETPGPAAPITYAITQPTCVLATGSVVLSGLPPTGIWTITRTPGGTTYTGTGTGTTITELATGTYTFTVTEASGCTSVSSGSVNINSQLVTPPKPIITAIDNYFESSSVNGNQWYNSSGKIIGATEQKYTPPSNDNYYVLVTNADGCISEASNIISFATGNEKTGVFEGISVYPVPTANHLIIENNRYLSSIDFEIVNANGKRIYNSILNNTSIVDVSRFSPGVYYIRFTRESSHYVFKFIKQ